MSVKANWSLTCNVTETLETGVPAASGSNAEIVHNGYSSSGNLTGSSTQPVTKVAAFLQALTAGAATIDLTSLTGTNGATVDGDGLKVQLIKFKASSTNANAITISEGAATGYELLGASFTFDLVAGQELMIFGNEATPEISATLKHIDLAGTDTQSVEVIVVMG